MDSPLVSIIIPTHNHSRYIVSAVLSALDQDYGNIEVIVVNDGSTDETEQLLQPLLPRIRYVYKNQGGTPSALNLGIEHSQSSYICWLSADDLFRRDKVSQQVNLMNQDQNLGFVYSSFQVIDAFGNITGSVNSYFTKDHKQLLQMLVKGCFINGSTVMMRKSALDVVGVFDVTLPQAHDYDLWCRFLRYYSCGFSYDFLTSYRWHGQNMSLNPDYACENRVRERIRLLFPEYFPEA